MVLRPELSGPSMTALPRILPSGDTALTVEFGSSIDPDINRRVLALDRNVASEAVTGVTETVPTYRSLLVHYDPLQIGYAELSDKLLALAQRPVPPETGIRRWRVPVVYGGDDGIDLDDVARAHNISTSEVIAKHTGSEYRVAMIGFTPGFAYLSGLDPSIATPRRESPRTYTPPGTISIGHTRYSTTGEVALRNSSGKIQVDGHFSVNGLDLSTITSHMSPADAEQLGRLDAPPAGGVEGTPDQDALDHAADDAPADHGEDNGEPQRQRQRGGKAEEEIGRQHQHFADGEVEHPRRLVDQHEGDAGQRQQRARAEPRQHDLEQEQPIHHAALSPAIRRDRSPTSPEPR